MAGGSEHDKTLRCDPQFSSGRKGSGYRLIRWADVHTSPKGEGFVVVETHLPLPAGT